MLESILDLFSRKEQPVLDRREAVRALGLTSLVGAFSSFFPEQARASKSHYDVLYYEGSLADSVRTLEDIGNKLNLKGKLRLAISSNEQFAVLYDRNTSQESKAVSTASSHTNVLQEIGVEITAQAVQESNYQTVHNVSFIMGPNYAAVKDRYRVVLKALGEEVKDKLVIEKTANGNYAVVAKVYTNRFDALAIARGYGEILKRDVEKF